MRRRFSDDDDYYYNPKREYTKEDFQDEAGTWAERLADSLDSKFNATARKFVRKYGYDESEIVSFLRQAFKDHMGL